MQIQEKIDPITQCGVPSKLASDHQKFMRHSRLFINCSKLMFCVFTTRRKTPFSIFTPLVSLGAIESSQYPAFRPRGHVRVFARLKLLYKSP